MRAGVIIIQDKKILLIHRFNEGKEYFVLPGGGVEAGESVADAATREAKEETGLDVVLSDKFLDYTDTRDGNPHRYYHVTSFTGDLALGGEEAIINNPENSYKLEWHPLGDLKTITFYPKELVRELISFE